MNLTSKIRLSLKRAFLGLLLVPLVMTPKLAMANVPVIDTINNAIQSAMAAAEALYFAADEAQQILIQQTIQDIPAAATQTELAAMSWESQLTNHKTNTDYRRDQANIAASAAITEDNETIRLLCTIDRATTTRLYTEALGHEEVVRLYKGWEYWDRYVSNGPKAIADINNSRCTAKRCIFLGFAESIQSFPTQTMNGRNDLDTGIFQKTIKELLNDMRRRKRDITL